jgi:hypothetical protein
VSVFYHASKLSTGLPAVPRTSTIGYDYGASIFSTEMPQKLRLTGWIFVCHFTMPCRDLTPRLTYFVETKDSLRRPAIDLQ